MTTETERKIREEIESIDWDAIDDQNRLPSIGIELHENAAFLEQFYPGTLGTVAGLMDGFAANVPNHMRRDEGHYIADGFAKAMVGAAANAAYRSLPTRSMREPPRVVPRGFSALLPSDHRGDWEVWPLVHPPFPHIGNPASKT